MRVEPGLSPSGGWEPVREYHVVFWRQPVAPEGHAQDSIMWAADENDVLDAVDVHEVIAWADAEARRRRSMYTLYAVIATAGERRKIWLAGVDPTVAGGPNFEQRRPPDVDPVGGTAAEVYRRNV